MSTNDRDKTKSETTTKNGVINRRSILLGGSTLAAASALGTNQLVKMAQAQPAPVATGGRKPNILILWGDDVGWWNVSAYNRGMMGYKTPNIDRIANEGALFTDWYGQQSCTAGRSTFITGQSPYSTGLLKVGLPGAKEGLQKEDVTLAELLKAQGYATGHFGKNHLGDQDEHLDRPRLRRVLRLALSPERRGRARESRLLQGSRAAQEIRDARRAS